MERRTALRQLPFQHALHEGARPVPHRRRRSGGIHLLRVPQEAGRIQLRTCPGPCPGGFPLHHTGTDKGAQYQGEKIRMDSKLIQSNIAKASRLEVILETVRVSTANLDLILLSGVLGKTDIDLLGSMTPKTATWTYYI